MTAIRYEWFNKETGEVRNTNSWVQVQEWIETEGGTFTKIEDERASQDEGYCMPGAAGANQRWKNYKY